MKKLMLVAAAAAMTGVAQAKLCDIEAVAAGCSVYNVKFTFKTLAAKNECRDGAKWLINTSRRLNPVTQNQDVWFRTDTIEDAAARTWAAVGEPVQPIHYLLATGRLAFNRPVFWMDNATRKFDGIIWQCTASCFEGGAPWNDRVINQSRINFAMWEKKTENALTFPIAKLKIGKPENDRSGFVNGEYRTEYATFDEEFNFRFLGRYGKTAQKVAAFWIPRVLGGQTIAAAGFGSFDSKNLRIKSISGNAVGMLIPLNFKLDECGNPEPFFCAIGFMCSDWRDWCCDGCYAGVRYVPASGTWSLKYNSSATKKANGDKAVLADFVPEYMMYSHARWQNQRNLDPFLHNDGDHYWIANEASADGTVPEGAFFYIGGSTQNKEVTLTAAINNLMSAQEDVFWVYENGQYYNGDDASGWITSVTLNNDGSIAAATLYKEAVDEAGNKTGALATVTDEGGNVSFDVDYEFVPQTGDAD